MSDSTASCEVAACDSPIHTRKSGYCRIHYMRMWRNGTLEPKKRFGGVYSHSNGYLQITDPTHPLADSKGSVLLHRAVLWDRFAGKTPSCAFCGVVLSWRRGQKHPVATAEHLDGNRKNNDPWNIVAACLSCNSARSWATTNR